MIHTSPSPTFRPTLHVAGCFLHHGNHYLFLHRLAAKSQGDRWGMPGGKVDLGETPQQAVVREVREETGIALEDTAVRPVGSVAVTHSTRDFVFHMYTATCDTLPLVRLCVGEHDTYRWLTLTEALMLPLVEDEDACIRLYQASGFADGAYAPYWTPERRARAAAVTSLADLVHVARDILAAQAAERPLAIVLGPMTTGGLGSAARNFRAFDLAVEALRTAGHNIFDISTFEEYVRGLSTHDPDNGVYDTAILETFCDGIYSSGHIETAYFLPGWETSVGARWERDRMPAYAIAVSEYPADLWTRCLDTLTQEGLL